MNHLAPHPCVAFKNSTTIFSDIAFLNNTGETCTMTKIIGRCSMLYFSLLLTKCGHACRRPLNDFGFDLTEFTRALWHPKLSQTFPLKIKMNIASIYTYAFPIQSANSFLSMKYIRISHIPMKLYVDFSRIKYEYRLNPIHSTRKVVEFRICTMSHKLHQYFVWYTFWSFKLDEKNIHVSYEIYVNESQV